MTTRALSSARLHFPSASSAGRHTEKRRNSAARTAVAAVRDNLLPFGARTLENGEQGTPKRKNPSKEDFRKHSESPLLDQR